MSTVDSAPPSQPLVLTDNKPALFLMRDQEKVPTTITVSGSSNFELMLFNIIATGTVKPAVPGTISLTLYGLSKGDATQASADPASWLPLASSEPEPIGGDGDPEETMWMIAGVDLMIYAGSGKMQGCFKSNVANHPIEPMDLTQRPGDITETDPLYIFAIGATFEPSEAPPAGTRADGLPPLCTVTRKGFTMDA